MKILKFEEWRELSNKDRDEILKKANAKPSLFELFLMALYKWIEKPKPPALLETKIFMYKSKNERRRQNVWRG